MCWEKTTKIIQAFSERKREKFVALIHRNAPENNLTQNVVTTDEMSAFELNNFVTGITLIAPRNIAVYKNRQQDLRVCIHFQNSSPLVFVRFHHTCMIYTFVREPWLFPHHSKPLNHREFFRLGTKMPSK